MLTTRCFTRILNHCVPRSWHVRLGIEYRTTALDVGITHARTHTCTEQTFLALERNTCIWFPRCMHFRSLALKRTHFFVDKI